jgi:hypothetical protein
MTIFTRPLALARSSSRATWNQLRPYSSAISTFDASST